ncbi:hypothetical protein CC80DRAFT_505479 [Byssothecium circinans]|uniref:Uncharacterized protein n=1 Tax=Byssothecium circinans TaxID=147558 RepID=A0A6A5U379_9PLEO|nr:hypothetical protein CC80DRAFT_505479 [Byssothecium circinans]
MSTIVEALAVFGASCSSQVISVQVIVIEEQRNYANILRSRSITWEDFIQLPNCYAAANFAESQLYERLRKHHDSRCECDHRVLFQTEGRELPSRNPKVRLLIPENAPLVPCNSPTSGRLSPPTPVPASNGSVLEITKKRRTPYDWEDWEPMKRIKVVSASGGL